MASIVIGAQSPHALSNRVANPAPQVGDLPLSRHRSALDGRDRSRPLRKAGRTFVPALAAMVLAATTIPVSAADYGPIAPRGRDVTIIEGERRTIYEYRQNGVLRMIRIVPTTGRPYYLVPADETQGYGNLENADMLIPKWILVEF